MKHLIILGDGMADHPVERLGGKTLMQHAHTPYMDLLAKQGRTGMLQTIPEGFAPGSEVANTAIMGYDLNSVYEGRGPLEAASIGYEMQPNDLALRCNILTLADGKIKNHHGGHLSTAESELLIQALNHTLASDVVSFVTGIQYRHLLIIKGGSKHIVCTPPHDNPEKAWKPLLVKAEKGWEDVREEGRMTANETAALINELIINSQDVLAKHPFNVQRAAEGKVQANSIWPWSGGYRPAMKTLSELYPCMKSGAVISAVDLIRGIGHYAGLKNIIVEGATGLYDTNYEGKAAAAINALQHNDFVYLHIEASDEAGHDGDLQLKLKTIEDLDRRTVGPIYNKVKGWDEPICIAILPDHPTPVEIRTHVDEPVPFLIWHKGIIADGVQTFDENSCRQGCFGLLKPNQFMPTFMGIE